MLDAVLNEGDVLRKAEVDDGLALRAGKPSHDKEIGALKLIQTLEAERLQHILLKVFIPDQQAWFGAIITTVQPNLALLPVGLSRAEWTLT